MSLEYITSTAQWQKIVDALPDFPGKVYYQPAYHSAYQINGDGQAAAIYYHHKTTRIFYPFLLKEVPAILGGRGFFDMQSAYGYGGPVAFDANSKSLQTFADEHARWVARHNIVAEFVRFNPFGQHDEFSSIVTPELNRNTVSIELEPDFSVILDKASSARRRNYKKAVKSGLNFCIDTNYSDFIAIYRQAMQRLDADQYYYFSAEYFAALAKMPEKQRFFTRVTDNSGRLLAAGIFLLDELAAHYHLGGSQLDARALQPDTFMLFSAAEHAAKAGKKTLHLGGGLSLAKDDGLFRFKAGFSAQRHRFYIGKKIHQPKQYAEFSQKWQKITGQPATILLHYHEGLANANL